MSRYNILRCHVQLQRNNVTATQIIPGSKERMVDADTVVANHAKPLDAKPPVAVLALDLVVAHDLGHVPGMFMLEILQEQSMFEVSRRPVVSTFNLLVVSTFNLLVVVLQDVIPVHVPLDSSAVDLQLA